MLYYAHILHLFLVEILYESEYIYSCHIWLNNIILLVILYIITCIFYSYLPLSSFTICILIKIYYSFSFSNALISKYITKL